MGEANGGHRSVFLAQSASIRVHLRLNSVGPPCFRVEFLSDFAFSPFRDFAFSNSRSFGRRPIAWLGWPSGGTRHPLS
jgi:hypothetical protein